MRTEEQIKTIKALINNCQWVTAFKVRKKRVEKETRKSRGKNGSRLHNNYPTLNLAVTLTFGTARGNNFREFLI